MEERTAAGAGGGSKGGGGGRLTRGRHPGWRQSCQELLDCLGCNVPLSKGIRAAEEAAAHSSWAGVSCLRGGGGYGCLKREELAKGVDAGVHEVGKREVDAGGVGRGGQEGIVPQGEREAPWARLEGRRSHISGRWHEGEGGVETMERGRERRHAPRRGHPRLPQK